MKIDNPLEKLPNKNHVYFSVGISLFIAILVVILKGFLPPEVPLYYGKAVGEEQLVPTLGLLFAPGVSLFVTILNVALSKSIKDVFFKKVLIVSALFVSILIAITVIKIVFLVGFF
ncbi:MAG: hypothetical protein ACHQUA_00845 [Microgenomates group bacterium]